MAKGRAVGRSQGWRLEVSGPADPRTVWQRYAEPGRWTSWAPHLTWVRASSPVIRPGTTGRVVALVLPARFRVDDVDPVSRRWSWTVRCLGVRLHLEHGVEARGTGCSTSLVVHGPTPVVLAYLPVAWWALRRLVRRPGAHSVQF